MKGNHGLDHKTRRKMYSLFENGMSIKDISIKTKLPYITVYYYIRRKGLISDIKKYTKTDHYQFDYKAYISELIKRCKEIANVDDHLFQEFSKTREWEDLIIRHSAQFTPSDYASMLGIEKYHEQFECVEEEDF